MAKKYILKERETNEEIYPITSSECIVTNDNSGVATKAETRRFIDDELGAASGQLEVLDSIKSYLDDDSNIANAVTKEIAEAKKQVFIDLWLNARPNLKNKNVGYNKDTQLFWVDFPFFDNIHFRIDDIGYEEAITILMRSNVSGNMSYPYNLGKIRINLSPFNYPNPTNIGYPLQYDNTMEYLILAEGASNYVGGANIGTNNTKLKGILGIVSGGGSINLSNTPELRWCVLRPTVNGVSINLKDSPHVELISLQKTVEQTAGQNITITVHSDVFAKLTDEGNAEWHQVLQDAQAKNIQFVSA